MKNPKREREDFRAYLAALDDAQLERVRQREMTAGRSDFANLAIDEWNRRDAARKAAPSTKA